ncbi:Protein AIM2 [Lachnellula suecica]|uniref:Protein AIM2 n=1 Tax=Lachnellula suecica TaxID=602035 RepID=A0A8T9BU16_9HELO|nr:Protein AIM2 [Lachnellula suecica]
MSYSNCVSGTVHDGHPVGKEELMYNLNTYVSAPIAGTTPKGIIVFIPDGFGWDLVNNRLLADKYAQNGNFLVLLPDFMNGHSMPVSAEPLLDRISKPASILTTLLLKPLLILRLASMAIPWLLKTRPGISHPRVTRFIGDLRSNAPPFETKNLKIGAAGFCWGGKHAFLLARDEVKTQVTRYGSGEKGPMVDACFVAYPSMLSVPGDVEGVSVPVSVAVGDNDRALGAKNTKVLQEILEVKLKGDHEVNIMEGAKHGFAIRLDPSIPEQVEQAEIAERQAINFFTKWFV